MKISPFLFAVELVLFMGRLALQVDGAHFATIFWMLLLIIDDKQLWWFNDALIFRWR